MEPITYTSYEAARIKGVDESTIRRQCMAGKLAGAYRGVLRSREIWMIPASALGLGGEMRLPACPQCGGRVDYTTEHCLCRVYTCSACGHSYIDRGRCEVLSEQQ